MINPNSVAFSLYTTLSSDAVLVSSGFHVDLHEVYNTNPDRTPWIGIYFAGAGIEPHRAQIQTPYMATFNFEVYVQDYSNAGGEAAANRVLTDLTPVFTAISSNRNLDTTVLQITRFEIEPFQMDIEQNDAMMTYLINISAEAYA